MSYDGGQGSAMMPERGVALHMGTSSVSAKRNVFSSMSSVGPEATMESSYFRCDQIDGVYNRRQRAAQRIEILHSFATIFPHGPP